MLDTLCISQFCLNDINKPDSIKSVRHYSSPNADIKGIKYSWAIYHPDVKKYEYAVRDKDGPMFKMTVDVNNNNTVVYGQYRNGEMTSPIIQMPSHSDDYELIDHFVAAADKYNSMVWWKEGIEDLILKILMAYFENFDQMLQCELLFCLSSMIYNYDGFNSKTLQGIPISNILGYATLNRTNIIVTGKSLNEALYEVSIPNFENKHHIAFYLDMDEKMIFTPPTICEAYNKFEPRSNLKSLILTSPFRLSYAILAAMVDMVSDDKFMPPLKFMTHLIREIHKLEAKRNEGSN